MLTLKTCSGGLIATVAGDPQDLFDVQYGHFKFSFILCVDRCAGVLSCVHHTHTANELDLILSFTCPLVLFHAIKPNVNIDHQ